MNLVFIILVICKVISQEVYKLSLLPLGCSSVCSDPRLLHVNSILINNITLPHEGQFDIVPLSATCELLRPPTEDFLGFVNCANPCLLNKENEYKIRALVIYGNEHCAPGTLTPASIPMLRVTKTLNILDGNWRVHIDGEVIDEPNWTIIKVVMGFVVSVLVLILVAVWWLKPWIRRTGPPNIYQLEYNLDTNHHNININNPKLTLNENKLNVFPTIQYQPPKLQKRSFSSFNSFNLKGINSDKKKLIASTRKSMPPVPPNAHLKSNPSNTSRQSLPVMNFPLNFDSPTVQYFQDTACVICLADYEPGERLRILTCKHGFHSKCIDSWLLNPSAHSVCPTCKSDLSIPLGLPPKLLNSTQPGPIVRFEEILGIAMPVLIYPEDPEYQNQLNISNH